jgi:hypothetical protein
MSEHFLTFEQARTSGPPRQLQLSIRDGQVAIETVCDYSSTPITTNQKGIPMPQFLVESPHTQEDCDKMIKMTQAMGYLTHYYWGGARSAITAAGQ